MNKLGFTLLFSFCMLSLALTAQNKSTKAQKFKFVKVSRDVKKESKIYNKAGWKVFPGNQPIAQQLNSSFDKQAETDEDGFPRWIIANGSSVAQTQAAAEMQATELAKNNLVGLLETHMKSVVESDVANNQLNSKDGASITKTIQVSANKVSKKLGYVQPLFKVYRNVEGTNNVEVQIMIGYSYEIAKKMILEEMRLEIQNEAEDIRKRYEKFLNPENYKTGEIINQAGTTNTN